MSDLGQQSLQEEIESRITAAYAAEGYVVETEDGIRRDVRARNDAALAAFKGREATSKLDKAKASLTPGELYRHVFPSGPGAEGDPEELDAEDRAAYERLKRDCWALTLPRPEGWIQRQLASAGSTSVLCRAKVMRGADPVVGAYVTNDPILIIEDSVSGQIEGLVRKADNLRRHMDMVLGRHPELQQRVFAELGRGIKRTAAALPAPARTPEAATRS
jgi:hypothetical protein